MSANALARISAAGLPRALLDAWFDRPSTILLAPTGRPDPLAPKATLAESFSSATGLFDALSAGRVPDAVHEVVLDLEAWPFTPAPEQLDPIVAARSADAAALARGRLLVFAPALDLLRPMTGRIPAGPALASAYDRLLAGPGAASSGAFEIQAQGIEGRRAFAAFADDALRSARRAHPGAPVFVGLSTNPSGRRVTPADLLAAVRATQPLATGYWLNVPGSGPRCPRCGAPRPAVAVAFLEALAGLRPAAPHDASPSSGGSLQPGRLGSDRDNDGQVGATLPTAAPSAASDTPLLGSAGELLGARQRPATWILAASQFGSVVGRAPAWRIMAGGTVYEPVSSRQAPSSLLPVVPTLVVHSEALLAEMAALGTVPSEVRAVLYDNERFPGTPADEQADPLAYDAKVAALGRAHGWVTICDLVEPDRLPIADRTPAKEVPPCGVIGLNTVQQSERDPAAYAALVARDAALVARLAPGRAVLAGLSSNPAGAPVTPAELAADIVATHGLVAGYWLNVPSPGPGCPRCHAPDPALMAEALALLARS